MPLTKQAFFEKIENRIFLIILLTAAACSIAVYSVTRSLFNDALQSEVLHTTNVVNEYAQGIVNQDSFRVLNAKEDMRSLVYREQQADLNKIRRISSIRYLFTAKRDADNKIVYVIDGLDLGAADFRFIGDPVETEILPQLNMCLKGNTVTATEVLYTEWGPIFLTCWPVRNEEDNVAGALVMEFDAEPLVQRNTSATWYSLGLSSIIALVFVIVSRVALHRVSEPYYKKLAYTDGLTGLNNRMAFELDLRTLERDGGIQEGFAIAVYDLNDLKMINDCLGHAAGDRFIKKMVDVIYKAFPAGAVHYRIGGDEFATVVLNKGRDWLEKRLSEAFVQSRCPEPLEEYFEFSYGTAQYRPNRDASLHDVLIQADRRMYNFKTRTKEERMRLPYDTPSVCHLE